MKKLALFLLLAAPAFGQVANPSIVLVASPPSGSCTSGLPDQQTIITGLLYSCQSGTWAQISGGGGGGGTVTSVAMTVPSWLTVGGSPVTTSGTLAVTATAGQTANEFLATPNGSTGPVGLRTIVAADVPTLNQSTTGNAATATNLASYPSLCTGSQFSQGLSSGSNNCATPSGGSGGYTNVVASSTSDTTVAAINAKCTGGQTYVASVPITFTAGGTINSGCTVSHWAGGIWSGSVSIAFDGNVTQLGDPTLFFNGPTITFSSSNYGSPSVQAHAPVEWWGAKGDNSTADAAAFQACITAVPVQCDIQQGTYVIASNVSGSAGHVGIHGQGMTSSFIKCTSATGNCLTFAGTGLGTSQIQGVVLDNFELYRSVAATSTSAFGLSISYCQLCKVNWVTVQDGGAKGIYLANSANSVIADTWATTTLNYTSSGLTDVYPLYIDGVAPPQSTNLQRVVVDNVGAVGATFHGAVLADSGGGSTNISDVTSEDLQVSNTAYGIEVTSPSGGGFHESDIHFNHSVLNGITVSAVKISGLAASDKGTAITFNGGDYNLALGATGPTIDCESSQNAQILGLQIVPNANGTDPIYANSCSQLVISSNTITGSPQDCIHLNATTSTSVLGNSCSSANSSGFVGMKSTNSSTGNTFAGNNITNSSSSASTGSSFDGTSGGNTEITDVFTLPGGSTTVSDLAGTNRWCDASACHNFGITFTQAPSVTFSVATGASASPAAPYLVAPVTGTVSHCYFTTQTSDSSTNLVFNVKFNGTSILSGSSATVTAGTSGGTISTFSLTSGSVTVTQGQKWEFDITGGTANWTGAMQCY